MKNISILTLILGALLTVFGIVPFVFSYPNSGSPISGPVNGWELFLMISYDAKFYGLIGGIVWLVISCYSLCRMKKV